MNKIIDLIKKSYFTNGALVIPYHNNERFNKRAIAYGCIIIGDIENDLCMLKHELVHVKQFYNSYGWFMIKKLFDREYRYDTELEAYAVQYLCQGDNIKIEDVAMKLVPYTTDLIPMIAIKLRKKMTEIIESDKDLGNLLQWATRKKSNDDDRT